MSFKCDRAAPVFSWPDLDQSVHPAAQNHHARGEEPAAVHIVHVARQLPLQQQKHRSENNTLLYTGWTLYEHITV